MVFGENYIRTLPARPDAQAMVWFHLVTASVLPRCGGGRGVCEPV